MERKKRILHLIQSLEIGGCEKMLLRTLPLLSHFEHRILTLKALGELAPQMESRGIRVKTLNQKSFWDISSYARLRKEIRDFSPDSIITYLFHADVIGRLFVPFISKAKVLPFLRTTYNYPRYRAARWFEKATHFLVPRYLVNSKAIQKYLEESVRVASKKITVIPNGIDLETIQGAKGAGVRKEFSLEDTMFVITCVANLASNKGHGYLLEAFEKLFHKERNISLFIVGEGEERGNLEEQKKSLGSREHIFFLGRRSDVPEILRASDCFVLPTLFEGMSNALLEAMAAGLPIITTDISENQAIIQDERNGLLVPVKNSDALLLALQRLMESSALREKLGQAALHNVEKRFSLSSVISLWNQTLSSL